MTLNYMLFAYGFQVVWSPELIVFTILLAVLYLLAVGRFRIHFADAAPVPPGKKLLFLTGLVLLYFGLGSPLNVVGHYMFSVHMVQQCVLYLIMPPLLLLGTPDWLLRPVFRKKPVQRLMRVFTNPFLGLLLFNSLFSLYHLPAILDEVMQSAALVNLSHLVLLGAAFVMWLPVVCPLPELDKLTELRKLGYMFANGVLLTPACALIIFAGAPVYATYLDGPTLLCTPFFSTTADIPKLITGLSTLEDQQLGGVLMKLLQEFTYGTVLVYNLRKWFNREKDADGFDPSDLERA